MFSLKDVFGVKNAFPGKAMHFRRKKVLAYKIFAVKKFWCRKICRKTLRSAKTPGLLPVPGEIKNRHAIIFKNRNDLKNFRVYYYIVWCVTIWR